jgi:membrane protein YdbS with pleckstrin-like domain
MRLNAPKNITFIIGVILLVIGLVVFLGKLSFFAGDVFWITFAGGALLALGCFLKGL